MECSKRARRERGWAATAVWVLIGSLLYTHFAGYPSTSQVPGGEAAARLDDYAVVPVSGALTGRLSRITAMRFEPGDRAEFASRAFVPDLQRALYVLDLATRTFTTYIDFSLVFARFVNGSSHGSGLTAIAFHPEYAQNGKFYTVHTEGAALAGSMVPSNQFLPGLDLSAGYTPSAPINPPAGTVSKQSVVIEWTDTDLTTTTFEGTAREVMRVGFTGGNHSIADILFNPAARAGDPDFANLYLAVGDGGAGQRDEQDTTIPQRLDASGGKILRITPDLDRRPADVLGGNGRYRIPSTGIDPNPFVDLDLPGRRPEIFAYGLRNPQRLSWDTVSNTFIAVDIGLFSWEEVNVIHKGANYGYSQREGPEQLFVGGSKDGQTGGQTNPPSLHPAPDTVTVAGLSAPVVPRYPAAAYSHHDGDAVAGGFVYRGTLMPHLYGKYVFGDITTGRVFYADLSDLLAADDADRTTLAPIRELQLLFDDPTDVPDRGAVPRRLFDVVADQYARRGGAAAGGSRLPQPGDHLSDASDIHGVPYGAGRADIRFAEDRDGELYVLSKSDGMIRSLVGSRTGVTATALTSSPNPSAIGASVQLTASVTAPMTPTGTVEFFEGSTLVGAVALENGRASIAVAGLPAGTHLFTARFVPADAALLESVGGVTHAVERPDLASSLGPAPTAVAPGSRLVFTETTANVGLAGAGASTTRYVLSTDATLGADIVLGSRSITALAPGTQSVGSLSLTVPASTSLGTYYLLACADATGVVAEAEEGNNCVTSAATVNLARPDLIVTSVTTAALSAPPGGTFMVADTVHNQGGLTSVSMTTRFYLSVDGARSPNDHLAGSRSVAALAAGSSSIKTDTRLTVPAAIPTGTYVLVACADDPSKNAELSETNNCTAASALLPVGRADLLITGLATSIAAIAPGKKFAVAAATMNSGTASSGSSTTRFYFSTDAARDAADVLLTGSVSVAGLAPGQSASASRSLTVPASMPDGSYRLLACADDTGTNVESDEINNCSTWPAAVLVGRPDLTASALSNPPALLVTDLKFTLTDTVTNIGDIGSTSTTTRYFASRDTIKSGDDVLLIGSRSVPSLAPGAASAGSKVVTVPPLAAGSYYLIACADATAVAAESREDNNCATSATTARVE